LGWWEPGAARLLQIRELFHRQRRRRVRLDIELAHIILPIGISFFTFQKVAYLVDSYTGQVQRQNFVEFCLFVLFFPQLIAGPIVHYSEVMPQFARRTIAGAGERFAIGLTVFAIGLAKKVLIADTFAVPASEVFDAAAAGQTPTLIDSWIGTLSYTFQIYFDFSGYSDSGRSAGCSASACRSISHRRTRPPRSPSLRAGISRCRVS
jgi:D-alanyl-lipoteichoic acid acyltransferase DltB (MBOAT superfamily)